MIEAIGLIAAVLIGGLLGLLGGGGSILALPVLTMVLGVSPKPAIVASLFVVALASIVGGVRSLRKGEVDLRRGALFAIGSVPGAVAGGTIGSHIDETLQLVLFAVVMVSTAVAMLTSGSRESMKRTVSDTTGTGQIVGGIVAGLMVGGLTGIVGAGGGFLIVPVLTLLFAVPMHRAIGTSMLVIAINSGAGLVGYLGDGATMAAVGGSSVGRMSLVSFIALFATAMTTGVVLTMPLRTRLDSGMLRKLFASFLVVIGGAMLIVYLP